jgi:hypothetical protein
VLSWGFFIGVFGAPGRSLRFDTIIFSLWLRGWSHNGIGIGAAGVALMDSLAWAGLLCFACVTLVFGRGSCSSARELSHVYVAEDGVKSMFAERYGWELARGRWPSQDGYGAIRSRRACLL